MKIPSTDSALHSSSLEESTTDAMLLAVLLTNIEESFLLVDKHFHIVSFNQKFIDLNRRFFLNELEVGKSLFHFLDSSVHELVRTTNETVLSGTPIVRDLETTLDNGETLYFQNTYKQALDPRGEVFGVYIVSKDLTEKRKAEKQLRASDMRYRALIEHSTEMIILTNAQREIIFVSPSFESVTGYSSSEIIGNQGALFTPEEDHEGTNKVVKQLQLLPGVPVNRLMRIRHKQGHLLWVEGTVTNLLEDENVGAFVSNYRDVTARIEADKKLKFSENRFRSIVQQYPLPVVTYDKEGVFTGANKAWEELWEDKIENVKGYNVRTDAQMQAVGFSVFVEQAYSGQVSTTPVFKYDPAQIGKLGRTRWIQIIFYPILNELKEITEVISITQDFTASKEADEKIAQNEIRFKSLIQNSYDGIALLSNVGSIIEMSPSGKRILGYEISDMIGEQRLDLIYIDDLAVIEESFIKCFTNPNEVFSYQYRIVLPNGKLRWLESTFHNQLNDPAVAAIVNNFRDITARKEAESELLKLNEQLKAAQHIAKLGYFEMQLNSDHRFLSDEMYLISDREIGDETFTEEAFIAQIHSDDKTSFLASRERLHVGSHFASEFRIITHLGNTKWVMNNVKLVLDAQGNPFKVEGTLQDITIIKQTEKELRRLNEELTHQARELSLSNKELEQFAYIASHDLQEPLRMVTSFLSQLEKKYNDQLDDKARQYIHFATDGAARMRQVILDLLEFSRVSKQVSAIESVNVKLIVEEVLSVNKLLIEEKKAIIRVNDLPEINASKTPVFQLFQNIIGNALKYAHGDRIPEITIGTESSKDEWIFFVKDNGIGIDSRFYEKIFVLFQRLHSKTEYSGTGIGLAICKKIVDAYGGKIWVESKEELGSTFYFTLKKKIKSRRI